MDATNPRSTPACKDKAVRFTRDVLGDSARAAEIEEESLEDYAETRSIHIINPTRRNRMARGKTKADLEQEIASLQEENQELQDQLAAVADIVAPDDMTPGIWRRKSVLRRK
jgi:hypothetical protein